MISIRKGQFETNSSSVHALIIDTEANGKLPTILNLDVDSDEGDYVRKFVRELDEEQTDKFVNWLYYHGVDEIKYHGSNKWLNDLAEKYKGIAIDKGLPCDEDDGWTTGALINLLLMDFEDYCGYDDIPADYDTQMTWWLESFD